MKQFAALILLPLMTVVLPVASRAGPPTTAPTTRPLDRRVERLEVSNETLEESLRKLQALTRTNILLDRRMVETVGIDLSDRRQTVIFDLDVRGALTVLLERFADRDTARLLAFDEFDGLIRVSTATDIERRQITTCIYDVRDFVDRFVLPNRPPQESPGDSPNASAGANAPKDVDRYVKQIATDATARPGETAMTRQECIDTLIRCLEEIVEPTLWRDNGGSTGAIREYSGVLIVTLTPDGHRQMERVLYHLRELRTSIDRHEPPSNKPIDMLAPIPEETSPTQGNPP